MKQAPQLKFASDSTSADFLVSRVIVAYQNLDPRNLDDVATLYTSDAYFEDPTHGVQSQRLRLSVLLVLVINVPLHYFWSMKRKREVCSLTLPL